MDWSPDWELRFRMALAMALLSLFSLAFVGVVAGIFGLVAQFLGFTILAGLALALLLLGAFALLELDQRNHVLSRAGAYDVTVEDAPRLHRVVTSVAQQANVQLPTLAVTGADRPEAFTAGFRPGTTTLVVSTGMLRALDDDELRAVVAHELAHVKHRDVAVMTAVSLPTAIAERLRDYATDDGERVVHGRYRPSKGNSKNVVAAVALLVGTVFAFVGRLLVASLSRARELAADRGAVAITGDPASLVSALERIEATMSDQSREDLRTHESVAAFSIVSPDSIGGPEITEPVRLGPEGGRTYTPNRLDRYLGEVLRTHPPIEERRRRLRDAARGL